MIVPHLIFAHMVADYLLQTNWLAARKGQAWDGLLLHGFMVFVISSLVLARYIEQAFIPVLILFAVHTAQDWFKVWFGHHFKIHLAWSYFADQLGHYAAVLVFQVLVGSQLSPAPSHLEIFVMTLGSALVAVTRFYDVSWWANWFGMIVYMERWQIWGALERIAMLLIAMLGVIPALLAPFCALPRLLWAWQNGSPLWKQKYGMMEWSLGIAFSICLGYLALFRLLDTF